MECKNIIELEFKSYPSWKVPTIDVKSSIGKQIKHYRRLNYIKQTELSAKLNHERGALHHLENKDMKLYNVDLIKDIIKELDIQDKLNINDDYLEFLLNNPCKKIIDTRKELNLTRQSFAELLSVSTTSIRRWELGNNNISRAKYEKLKILIHKKNKINENNH